MSLGKILPVGIVEKIFPNNLKSTPLTDKALKIDIIFQNGCMIFTNK